ncbi:MAG: NAD-dependent DNA ligase LigA [Clostridia bacterium]|nr:NAD-dependent DNA ligase LigA [Clostridia bacterium]
MKNARMHELVKTLNRYAYEYYTLDNPTVSDAQYDKLYDELVALEKELGTVLHDSPSRRVGGEIIKEFKQHKHASRLYSLDKCNSFDELREWDAKIKKAVGEVCYTLEYKLDGLTLCLTYDDGKLVTAATRGDGSVGEDVTEQVKTIKSVPLSIPYSEFLEVQGEGIMTVSALNAYNEKAKNNGTELLKNARNGVAGAIRNLNPKVTASRNLDVIFYNVNTVSDEEKLTSQQQYVEFLTKNLFKTIPPFVSSDIEQIIEKISKVDRQSLDFVIDGMVIKVNDQNARKKLGYTEKFPKWAIAYKFEAEETSTLLKDVLWQVGRTGKVTPIAVLEAVELCGATVRRATLNNYSDVLRKKLKKGSTVFVRRSNDVIPEVLGIAQEGDGVEIEKPVVCPSCGQPLHEEGPLLFCSNEYGCKPQICGRIEHFVSKDCMDIEGLSEKTIEQAYEILGVRTCADLYSLTQDDLLKLPGFKDKKPKKIIDAIEKSKTVDLPHFINALGIRNVGKKTAQDLAAEFGSLEKLSHADKEQLLKIDEVGEIVAQDIIEFFAKHADVVEKFRSIGIDPQIKESGDKFKGLKFVLTGSLQNFTRSQASAIIESEGGSVQSSVTKETDFVVAGEEAGSKLEKAKKLGKKILDEKAFLDMINS